MTKPASPRSRARDPAIFKPAPEALHEPTIAIKGRISASRTPRAKQKRCIVEFRQPRRIAVLARRDTMDAEPFARG